MSRKTRYLRCLRFIFKLLTSGSTVQTVRYNDKEAQFTVTNPNDHIQSFWCDGQFYESGNNGMLSFIAKHYSGGAFIDIGAHRGNHTLFFLKVCNADSVVCFEPHPDNFSILKQHIERNKENDKTKLHNLALGNQEGTCSMSRLSHHHNSGAFCVTQGTSVRVATLDHLLAKSEVSPVLVKINCEGYNEKVIEGGSQFFATHNPDVFIECETLEILKQTDAWMNKLGYTLDKNKTFNRTPTYLWKKR